MIIVRERRCTLIRPDMSGGVKRFDMHTRVRILHTQARRALSLRRGFRPQILADRSLLRCVYTLAHNERPGHYIALTPSSPRPAAVSTAWNDLHAGLGFKRCPTGKEDPSSLAERRRCRNIADSRGQPITAVTSFSRAYYFLSEELGARTKRVIYLKRFVASKADDNSALAITKTALSRRAEWTKE